MDKNTVMAYLTERRMSSLGNLASHFDNSVEALIPLIRTLESDNRLRLSAARCQGSCGDCDSCDSIITMLPLSETTIIISLEKAEDML